MSKRVKTLLVALVVTLGLSLSGCAKMSSAAIVGDVEIPLSTIQNSVENILAERAQVDTSNMDLPMEDYLQRSQAQFHISVALLNNLADEFGVEVTSSEIANERKFIIEQLGGEEQLVPALVGATIAASDLDIYISASTIYDKIGEILLSQGIARSEIAEAQQSLLVKKANELKVVVNPRYGIWDAATATIKPNSASNDAVRPNQ
jgi:hypothetical protein